VRLPTTGTAFAGGGTLAFREEESPTDVSRWPNKRDIPGVIDLLLIKEYHQIQLNVVIAEVDSLKIRDIGLDFRASGNGWSFLSNIGSNSGFPTQLFVRDPNPVTGEGLQFGQAVSGILQARSGAFQLLALYRLLQNRDITRILAQPNLVIKNGRSGGFLAGGEFPVVQTLADTSTVEFKPFGVRLDFLPTVTWSNTIDLRVFPEVSELDPAVAVQGIPGLKVRRSVTRVEMQEGESLVIAGLLDKRVLKDLTKFPLLGDIPILGAIFRSTRFRNLETELVFVITPRIVKAMKPGEKPQLPSPEKYDDPDIRQVPLPSQPSRAPAKPMPQGPTIP
jgi:pilus assembly protein CpaC